MQQCSRRSAKPFVFKSAVIATIRLSTLRRVVGSDLADAYARVGEKALARQYGEEALAMIDSRAAPLSSWSDTEQRRVEIRSAVEDLLRKLNATGATPSEREPVENPSQ
jgi:hypothetical protein